MLNGNDGRLLKFKRSSTEVDFSYVLSVRFWLSITEMITLRKATKWLTCFSIVNLILGCLYLKRLKSLMNFVPANVIRISSKYL